jgi:hypothetical protein
MSRSATMRGVRVLSDHQEASLADRNSDRPPGHPSPHFEQPRSIQADIPGANARPIRVARVSSQARIPQSDEGEGASPPKIPVFASTRAAVSPPAEWKIPSNDVVRQGESPDPARRPRRRHGGRRRRAVQEAPGPDQSRWRRWLQWRWRFRCRQPSRPRDFPAAAPSRDPSPRRTVTLVEAATSCATCCGLRRCRGVEPDGNRGTTPARPGGGGSRAAP